jgi:hypothetical protein
MHIRKTFWIALIFLVSVGAVSATAYTLRTISLYAGVCDDNLQGFPGLLQAAGFVPSGRCTKTTAGACQVDQVCVVNGKKGHCVSQVIQTKTYCICKPNKITP